MPTSTPQRTPADLDPIARVDAALHHWLPPLTAEPKDLCDAMRYAIFPGGKRLRPKLVYAAGKALRATPETLDAPACAVELIHAYSLIHDDLPAMDDDDLRRGRATTHKVFGEATAILAGDAMQTLAFRIVADNPALADNPQARANSVATLAASAGWSGMAGGQAMDMAAEGSHYQLCELETVHRKKTGALLRACALMACDCASGVTSEQRQTLDHFADCIGLAFQIQDDILDIEASTQQLGKRQGADTARDKATYPALLGLPEAKTRAACLFQQALDALSSFGDDAEALASLARDIMQRDH